MKLFLFSDDIKNPELRSEFNKVARFKFNTHTNTKSVQHFCILAMNMWKPKLKHHLQCILKKIKEDLINGEINYVHGLEDSTL